MPTNNFTKRFNRLSNLMSGLIPPGWMIDAVISDYILKGSLDRAQSDAIENRPARDEHCLFAKIHHRTGKCVAGCYHQRLLKSGFMVDCIGIESETLAEFLENIKSENKFN